MAEPIINKVEESGLISLDLEKYYPAGSILVFDVKDHLFMGLILKEKDFRRVILEFEDVPDPEQKQFKIEISRTDFIFLLDE